jgi:hypothetical protein
MIWVMYGGIIVGVILMIAAVIVVIPPILRTKKHAEAIVPAALVAKFQKAQDDIDRVQRASALIEELVTRSRDAVTRIRAAVEVLRSLRVVPTPNRD